MHAGGIFSDFAKALDCMNHEVLLTKLYLYGIWRVPEDWFRSYLTHRRQKVEIKSPNSTQNFFSGWGTLKRVRQGSIVEPDQEGNKLQRPNSGFNQHTPHEAQYTS
jgi:hypothetical protein